MGRLLAIIAAAIVLFTAGALFLVNRLTEYQPAPRSASDRASDRAAPTAAPDLPAYPPPPADFTQEGPGAPIVIPAGPMVGGAVRNESPPIQGPPPVPLPEDPEERGATISRIRRNRVNEQLERNNQRNRERLGLRPGEDPPPPPPSPSPQQ